MSNFQFPLLSRCFHGSELTLSLPPNLPEAVSGCSCMGRDSQAHRVSPWLEQREALLPSWLEIQWEHEQGPCVCGAGRVQQLWPGLLRHPSPRDHHPACCWAEQPWGSWNKEVWLLQSFPHTELGSTNYPHCGSFSSTRTGLRYNMAQPPPTLTPTNHSHYLSSASPAPPWRTRWGTRWGTASEVLHKPLPVLLFLSPQLWQRLTPAMPTEHQQRGNY